MLRPNEPPKTECGCPSGGGGIKNGHIRYPSYGGTQKRRRRKKERKKEKKRTNVYDEPPEHKLGRNHERTFIGKSMIRTGKDISQSTIHQPRPGVRRFAVAETAGAIFPGASVE